MDPNQLIQALLANKSQPPPAPPGGVQGGMPMDVMSQLLGQQPQQQDILTALIEQILQGSGLPQQGGGQGMPPMPPMPQGQPGMQPMPQVGAPQMPPGPPMPQVGTPNVPPGMQGLPPGMMPL